MITGHFGLAAAVKSAEKPVPLWALMLATVWLDVLFTPLFLAGVETIHRLGNRTRRPAISVHAYGVDAPRVATHVNRMLAAVD